MAGWGSSGLLVQSHRCHSHLPAPPPAPPYTSPYTGYTRYHAHKYEVSPYPTPATYSAYSRSSSGSRLSRGASLQDCSISSPSSPKAQRRLARQASLETDQPSVYSRAGAGRLLPPEPRRRRPVDCSRICAGILIGNGETVCDLAYLRSQGVTHVLNTAEQHVSVSQSKLAKAGIQYFGFHVDDLPHCNIGRYFPSTTEFIHRAVTGGGLVAVNCYMGLSRSASCVLAYLMEKHDMSLRMALDFVKKSRGVRPNEGFLAQLRELERRLARRRV